MSLALPHALPNDPMIRVDLISGASSGAAEAAGRIRSVNKWRLTLCAAKTGSEFGRNF
jgi:hypothetical protein